MPKAITIKLFVVFVFLFSSVALVAQGPDFPTVQYTQELWSLNPPKYLVRVNTIGNARYESTPNSTEQSGQNYTLEFNISETNKDKIFNALEGLSFFDKTVDDVTPGDGGSRALIYLYGETQTVASYHATSNPLAQKLTSLFQSISTTLETGRRLDNLHQQKDPGLADAVSRMLARAQAGELAELQTIAPVLQSIAMDQSLAAALRAQVRTVMKIAAGK